MLLSLSTNFARGPFQGYVPDLVPERQVGLASSMVGLMQVLGQRRWASGSAAIALSRGSVELAVFAIAAVEVVTMLSVVLRVPNGPPAKPRNGRSWLEHRRPRRGAPTSSASGATSGSSRRDCSSSWAAPRC